MLIGYTRDMQGYDMYRCHSFELVIPPLIYQLIAVILPFQY